MNPVYLLADTKNFASFYCKIGIVRKASARNRYVLQIVLPYVFRKSMCLYNAKIYVIKNWFYAGLSLTYCNTVMITIHK